MNFEHLTNTFGKVHGHNLPAIVGALVGIAFLFLVFKARDVVMKVVFLLIAAAVFAAAYWWFAHIRS